MITDKETIKELGAEAQIKKMKPTKEEILKMTKQELQDYKWNDKIKLETKKENIACSYCSNCYDCSNCSYCSYCSNCYDCSNCSYCSYCYNCLYCRDFHNHRSGYYICNIEVTKEEFEKKKKEIENE